MCNQSVARGRGKKMTMGKRHQVMCTLFFVLHNNTITVLIF